MCDRSVRKEVKQPNGTPDLENFSNVKSVMAKKEDKED